MFIHKKHDIVRPFAREEHTENGHYYRTEEGKLYPSVTTVFKLIDPAEEKPWYPRWINKLARENNCTYEEAILLAKKVGKGSTDVGTELHRLAEDYINNKEIIYEPENYINNFEKNPIDLFNPLKTHLDGYIGTVHGTEAKIYSDDLEIAGTSDLVAEYDGILSIIDYKNSRKPKSLSNLKESHYFEQICCYGKLWEYCTGQKIEQGVIIVIQWDGKVKPFKVILDEYENSLYTLLLKYEAIK